MPLFYRGIGYPRTISRLQPTNHYRHLLSLPGQRPLRPYVRTESGTKIANSRADQKSVVSTGWASGQAAWAVPAPGLPNTSRRAATRALTGFQSEIARSQAGMCSVGTKLLEVMLIGKINGTSWS